MFDDGAPLLETFLFDFAGDLYGQTIEIAFIAWLRAEQKFESIEALTAQMAADSAQARAALQRSAGAFPALREV
jgi:riboflavin kinase/FMN adenylyltransferase